MKRGGHLTCLGFERSHYRWDEERGSYLHDWGSIGVSIGGMKRGGHLYMFGVQEEALRR